jgi:hypothetical protein
MKKRLTLFTCLFASVTLLAQSPVQQDLVIATPDTTDGGVVPGRLLAAANGDFIVAGSVDSQGYLLRMSRCGQTLWTQHYLLGSLTELVSLAELPTGELVAVGACVNCAPNDSTKKALAIKTDAQGQLLGHATFGKPGFDANAAHVITTSTGQAALTGKTVLAAGLGPSDAFLAVLDAQLQPDFYQTYDHYFYDVGLALDETPDGGFVIAGYSVAVFFGPRYAQLFRTDAAGAQLWKHVSAYENSEFDAVHATADGRILALGDRLVNLPDDRDVYLAVHDASNGGLVTERLYGSAVEDIGKSIEPVAGGFLCGGVYGLPTQSGHSWRAWVFHLDDGYALTEEFFHDGYLLGHFLVNAMPLSDDGRAFAYYSWNIFFATHELMFYKRTWPGEHAALSHAAGHHQLVARDLATNHGAVRYAGTVADPSAYDAIHLDVLRENVLQTTLTDDSPQAFDFTTTIPAELADYTLHLYGVKNQQRVSETDACYVVAGDAYVIQGQSNAVAGLPFDPDNVIDHAYRHHRSPFIRTFGRTVLGDLVYHWRRESDLRFKYDDNFVGQWGLVLANRIVDTYGIPVAMINGGTGGISIDDMLADPADHGNLTTSYGRFLHRVERSGLRENLRGVLMFQGETNAAGNFWDTADEYYQKFATLNDAWSVDFPTGADHGYLFQIRPGTYWAGATLHTCLQIAEAQRRLAEDLPAWQLMSTTGMNHDGTHYHYPNGYERAGNDLFRLLARDLYGAAPAADIEPPTVDSAYFSNCELTEITLVLRHTADTYTWTPGWESDFYLEGSSGVTVQAGSIDGSSVRLQLSGAPGAGFTGLSYTSHPEGDAAPVKNANGIGMVMFYNQPVGPCHTTISIEDRPRISPAITLYPNPVDDRLTLRLSGTVEGSVYSVEVRDLLGRPVVPMRWIKGAGATIEAGSWPAGTYWLVVRHEGMVVASDRFVKG